MCKEKLLQQEIYLDGECAMLIAVSHLTLAFIDPLTCILRYV